MSADLRVTGYEPLISPGLLLHEIPATVDSEKTIARARSESAAVINHQDDRLLVVVGPCSIHDPNQALEYAKKLAEKIKDLPGLVVVMRAYFESECSRVGPSEKVLKRRGQERRGEPDGTE